MRELMEAHPIVAKFVEDFDEVRVIHNASELLPVMKEIEKEVRNEWNAAYIQSLCNKLIVDVARIFDKDDPRTFDHVSRISDYIAYHYFEIESIEDIADAVGLNKVYMQRIFHEKREMTVGQFLKKPYPGGQYFERHLSPDSRGGRTGRIPFPPGILHLFPGNVRHFTKAVQGSVKM